MGGRGSVEGEVMVRATNDNKRYGPDSMKKTPNILY